MAVLKFGRLTRGAADRPTEASSTGLRRHSGILYVGQVTSCYGYSNNNHISVIRRGASYWYVTRIATPSSENVRVVDEATLAMRTLKALLANWAVVQGV